MRADPNPGGPRFYKKGELGHRPVRREGHVETGRECQVETEGWKDTSAHQGKPKILANHGTEEARRLPDRFWRSAVVVTAGFGDSGIPALRTSREEIPVT